ncbi:MAG TPA: hypothetical protein VGN23_07495 [Verrucomicrobiae bacterium]|jgi:hypothetical protein
MADHEIVSAIADALPGAAGGTAKIGIAVVDAIFKKVDDTQNKTNDLVATVQQINDKIKQINNPQADTDKQFIDTTKAVAEANAQGHGLAAELQASSALQAASREQIESRNDLTAGDKAKQEVRQRHSELLHAQEIFDSHGSATDIIKNKQNAEAAAKRDEGIILAHNDLQQQIVDAKEKVEADKRTHDVDTGAWANDFSLQDNLRKQAEEENSGYLKAKQKLPGEEADKAKADKTWSDLEGAKNLVVQLKQAADLAEQKLAEVNSSAKFGALPSSGIQIDTAAITTTIQSMQQSFQTYHQTVLQGLEQLNAKVQESTAEIRSEIQTIQSQHQYNHGL